jgi:hypothetical protein
VVAQVVILRVQVIYGMNTAFSFVAVNAVVGVFSANVFFSSWVDEQCILHLLLELSIRHRMPGQVFGDFLLADAAVYL